MTEQQLLSMVKIDLGIMTTAYDDRLTQLINTAQQLIAREGAVLDLSSYEDIQLVVMYTSYLWRRRDNGAAMPRMLRWALNNRIFSAKAAGD